MGKLVATGTSALLTSKTVATGTSALVVSATIERQFYSPATYAIFFYHTHFNIIIVYFT